MRGSATIRLARAEDAAGIQAIYAPFVRETAVSFEIEPPTIEEIRHRIADAHNRFPWLVCENEAEIAGYVYASPHSDRAAYAWSVNVSVYIDPRHRRSGFGKALYTSLFAVLRLQGFVNAYAGATLPNPGSVGLHEVMGFKLVGVYDAVGYKLGAWHSVGWWQLALHERSLTPAPPLSIAEVKDGKEWAAALDSGLPFVKQ